jgi:hypothetical protein
MGSLRFSVGGASSRPRYCRALLEADVADHLSQELFVVREFAILDILPQQIAENASKIFVPRERHERSRVG